MLSPTLRSLIPAKYPGFFLVAEIGEGEVGEGVDRHSDSEEPNEKVVAGKEHGFCHGIEEYGNQQDEERGGEADGYE